MQTIAKRATSPGLTRGHDDAALTPDTFHDPTQEDTVSEFKAKAHAAERNAVALVSDGVPRCPKILVLLTPERISADFVPVAAHTCGIITGRKVQYLKRRQIKSSGLGNFSIGCVPDRHLQIVER